MSYQHIKLRRGVTLTELLVVVSIMVMVAAAFVPLVQPILRGQNTREASRQLNVMIAGAQARAVAQGRPVGIWLERAEHEASSPPEKWYTVYRVFQATEPVPYTGDFFDSRVRIQRHPVNPNIWEAIIQPVGVPTGAITQVRPGDSIRFDHRGPRYAVREVSAFKIGFILPPELMKLPVGVRETVPEYHVLSPAKYLTAPMGVAFEVFRQPIKSTSAPIEMPNNTAIDLSVSGYVNPNLSTSLSSFREISPIYDIAIMFGPKGGVESVYYISHEVGIPTVSVQPFGNISLLIGRDNKIGKDLQGNPLPLQPGVASGNILAEAKSLADATLKNAMGPLGIGNLGEQSNIWLSIAGHSGRVQTGPNGGILPTTLAALIPTSDARPLVQEARRHADTGQTIGGR